MGSVAEREHVPEVWRDQIPDKHFWAFYYFCKRQGDRVQVRKRNGLADLYVWKRED